MNITVPHRFAPLPVKLFENGEIENFAYQNLTAPDSILDQNIYSEYELLLDEVKERINMTEQLKYTMPSYWEVPIKTLQ